jgi:hypothetical protein
MVEETAGERETWVSTERGVVARKNVVSQIGEFAMPGREGTERILERETGGEPPHGTARREQTIQEAESSEATTYTRQYH